MSKLFENTIFFMIAIMTLLCGCSHEYDFQSAKYKKYIAGISTGEYVIPWNSAKGQQLFNETKYKKTFFQLAHHFSGQKYMSTCGPATLRIILSAIYEHQNIDFPLDLENSFKKNKNGITYGLFNFTERNAFNKYEGKNINQNYDIIARLKKRNNHFEGGMNIEDIEELLASYDNLSAKMYIVKNNDLNLKNIDNFRKIIKEITSSENKYMIVNYDLRAMYDINSGHFASIAAYNDKEDMVLIMDVASHLGVWSWIKTEELYKDMNSDLCENCNRGYILIKENEIKSLKNR